tara:strand:+ start:383 stop:1234 length:852 start_codon:yes stop_codon:yes gene_type:complete
MDIIQCFHINSTCTSNGTSYICEVETPTSNNVFDYLIGLSLVGIFMLIYQVFKYSTYAYGWWHTADRLIKTNLLPLQIYMRDMDKIVKTLKSGDGDSGQLEYLRNQYELFIEKDHFCWVKYKNPRWKQNSTNTYRKCYCCAKIRRPRFLFEMCRYDRDGKKILIKREIRRLKKCPLLYIGETFGSPDCCNLYTPADDFEIIDEKNVFFGMYKPYFGDNHMKAYDLNIKGKIRRHVNGIDDSCHRFLCGFWRAIELQDLEISIKSELDEEHLRADLRADQKLTF